jgi:hypothetical protein
VASGEATPSPVTRHPSPVTPHPSPVIGGLADEWVSYILSAEEYKKGGYEASMSFYGETLGQVIVEGVVKGAMHLK